MFWDGTRWVDERPTPTPAVFNGPRRLRDWIATIPIVLLVPTLLVPFLPAMATTVGPALTVSGPATPGSTVAVKASGFASGTMLQLQWDGSTSGMPTVRTSTAAALTLSVRVPSKAKLGTHVLSAVLPAWTQYVVRFGSASSVSPAPLRSSGSSRSSGTLGTTDTLGAATPSHGRTVLASTNVMVVAKVSGPVPTATPAATPAGAAAPTAAPTTAPTPKPTAVPTAAPTVAPPAAPTAAPPAGSCPASLQAAVNAAPAGATLDETGCSFHERVTIAKSLTLRGATFEGTGLGVPLQQGVLTLSGSNITVSGIRISGSAGAGLQVTGASITVADSSLDHNTQEGYNVSGATNVTFLRDHIAYNNVALTVDPGWEAGGGKAHGTNIVFDGCEVDHNGGPGIWFDQWYPAGTPASAKNYNPGAVVRNSRVHDNTGAGIMYEVSRGATIADNVVWHNGSASDGWVWAAGILLSSSSDANVYGNLVAWNLDGISVVSQNRADAPGTVSGNSIHDNTVALGTPVAGDSSDKTLLAFNEDWSSGMYAASAANTAARNAYWSLAPEPQWARFGQWNGTSVQTLAALNGTPIGGASSYLSTAGLDGLLSAAGLPLAP